MGAVTEEAYARLWLAKALIEQRRHLEAVAELERSLVFYHCVGATRYIREGERVLAPSGASRA